MSSTVYRGRSAPVVDPVADRIEANPLFHELVRKRDIASFVTVGLTMVIYFGYIFLLAFAPGIMSTQVSGVITMGFPIALIVIVVTVLIVGFFVWQANGTLERLRERIVMEARR